MTDGRGSKVATAQYCRMEQKEACYGKSNRRCLINKEGTRTAKHIRSHHPCSEN